MIAEILGNNIFCKFLEYSCVTSTIVLQENWFHYGPYYIIVFYIVTVFHCSSDSSNNVQERAVLIFKWCIIDGKFIKILKDLNSEQFIFRTCTNSSGSHGLRIFDSSRYDPLDATNVHADVCSQ